MISLALRLFSRSINVSRPQDRRKATRYFAKHYRIQGSNEAKMDLIGVQICWIEIFGRRSQAADPPDDASIVMFHRVSGRC